MSSNMLTMSSHTTKGQPEGRPKDHPHAACRYPSATSSPKLSLNSWMMTTASGATWYSSNAEVLDLSLNTTQAYRQFRLSRMSRGTCRGSLTGLAVTKSMDTRAGCTAMA